jgi:hypothetical protein
MVLHDSVNGFLKNLSKQVIVIKGHVLQTFLALIIIINNITCNSIII